MLVGESCLEPALLYRIKDLLTIPAPVGSNPQRKEAAAPHTLKSRPPPTSLLPPMPFEDAALPPSPPPLPSQHRHIGRSSPRSENAACVAALVADGAAESSNCLHLVPPIRSGREERRSHWDEYDVPIVVPTPRRGAESARLVNPSVLCRRGRLLLAARAMWPVAVQPPCTDVWRSHTVLTSVAFDGAAHALVRAPNASLLNAARFTAATDARVCIADLTASDDDTEARGAAFASSSSSSADGKLLDGLGGGGIVDGNAQALRCARLGLPSSVGLGMEDPRLFDVAAAATSSSSSSGGGGPSGSAASAASAANAAAASVGSGLLISYTAPKRQPRRTIDL